MRPDLTDPEVELLVGGVSDDVAFDWVLIHLGLRANPPTVPGPPSTIEVDAAFATLDRLSAAGLVRIGHTAYADGGPPGRVAPVNHVEEPIDQVRAKVDEACRSGEDWEWSCWVVTTAEGDAVAQRALSEK